MICTPFTPGVKLNERLFDDVRNKRVKVLASQQDPITTISKTNDDTHSYLSIYSLYYLVVCNEFANL